jgi:hypothetical protein
MPITVPFRRTQGIVRPSDTQILTDLSSSGGMAALRVG